MTSLEGRSLLSTTAAVVSAAADVSTVSVDNTQFTNDLYQTLLLRTPTTTEVDFWVAKLDKGASRLAVTVRFLASPEYTSTHPDSTSYVTGLYQDVLGRAPRTAGEQFWVSALDHKQAGRARLAYDFLSSPEAIQQSADGTSTLLGLAQGGIKSVTVNPVDSSAISGNIAQVSTTYNKNDFRVRTITFSVTGSGTYVLDQSSSWGVLNNTGKTWKGYKLTIDAERSSAQPTINSSADLGAIFPAPTIDPARRVVTYTGNYPTSAVRGFQPWTTIFARGPGVIVITEVPIL